MKQSSSWWQHIIPQHLLSRCAGSLANCRCDWFKNWAIKTFCRHYNVNLTEAEITDYRGYADFNAFFTRRLQTGARPLPDDNKDIISPVDGRVSELGEIHAGSALQAKGKSFTVQSLLGDEALAFKFSTGSFLTAYLSPKDYHRIHMPCDGRLVAMQYIPGRLFSVNETSVANIDGLFARNERVVCHFESDFGPFVVVAVGAVIVGSIVTAWHGEVNLAHPAHRVKRWTYEQAPDELRRGDEMGYFKLGSTVLILFPENTVTWLSALRAGSSLRMGQVVANRKE